MKNNKGNLQVGLCENDDVQWNDVNVGMHSDKKHNSTVSHTTKK